ALFGILWFDHAVQGWTIPKGGVFDQGVKGVGVTLLLLFVLPLGTRELATLFAAEHVRPFRTIAVAGSALLSLHAFAQQFAFFHGRAVGRHKLIPWLSPGKTWEGLAGGLVLAGVIGAAFAPSIIDLEWYKGALFGVLIGGIGQLGDLLESMMKRDAEVKDSS